MKIEYYSDIHNEFRRDYWFPPGWKSEDKSDTVLVLAGDIDTNRRKLREYLDMLATIYSVVVYVPGNHEYYKKDFLQERKALREMSDDNVHVLDRDVLVFDELVIIGATLWSDFNEEPVTKALIHQNVMDFSLIRFKDKKMNPHHMTEQFRWSVAYIWDKLFEIKGRKRLVVTHFPPHRDCMHEKWGTQQTMIGDYFYPTVPDPLFKKADYWIYGHSHDNVCIEKEGCEVVSNQVGYPNENKLVHKKTIEI